ncbi:hypothetical protein [Cytobacillus sp.]
MEEVISSYLIQMKEENDDFINKFSQINAKNQISVKEKSIQLNKERKSDEHIAGAEEKSMRLARASVYQASKAYKNNLRALEEELNETEGLKEAESVMQSDSSQRAKAAIFSSLEDQVFMMKKQGMNVEDIAKKLGKGKTEIELMLKFRQNQQE